MQHETAFYPEQYQGDISKLNYITNLLYDCMKLNQDFKEKIKPVTLYQLSGDYTELKKELKQKEMDEYDYKRHIPYVKVDGKLRDEDEVKRSMMPRFASILDKAITRKPKPGETLPEACQHNEWEISSLGLDFKTLSYQNFIEAMKLKNPTDRQIRNALVSYVIQFLINGGLIKDSHELRVFERIMHKYTYLASALYFHGLFEKENKGLFGLSKSNTNILFAMIYGNDFRELCVLEGIDNDNCELFAILNKHRVRLLENNSLLTRPNIDVVPSGDQYAQLAVDCIVQSLIYTLLGVDYTMHSPSLLDSVPNLPDYSELAVLSRFGVPQDIYMPLANYRSVLGE